MDGRAYASLLGNLERMGSLLMCEYCGVETSALGNQCMCSNCESLVFSTRSIIEKKDTVLLDTLENINRSADASDYDSVLRMYDQLMAERKEPSLLYAAAIAHLKYSNYEIMKIGYMSTGFMEENTVHRDKAAKLVSSAKKLLAKAISIANSEMAKGNSPVSLVYCKFLAQIKMDSVRGAKQTLGMLEKMGNEYAYNYAQMVFEAHMQRYGNAMKIAEKLTSEKSFSLNAFYYIGLGLFKTGRLKDAKVLLQALDGILRSGNLDALIFEVNAQMSSWK